MNITCLIRKPALIAVTLAFASPLALLGRPLEAATPPDQLPSVAVKYGDLDVSRPAGVEALFKRLSGAANTLCAQYDGRELARHAMFSACVDHAIAGAVVQAHLPALAALYTDKTGHKLAGDSLLTAHR